VPGQRAGTINRKLTFGWAVPISPKQKRGAVHSSDRQLRENKGDEMDAKIKQSQRTLKIHITRKRKNRVK